MKIKNYILLLLLTLALLVTVTACGGKSKDTDTHYCSYSDWDTVSEADCENDGLREKTCYGCGTKQTETIEAYGHTYSRHLGGFVPDGDDFVYEEGCLNGSCESKKRYDTKCSIRVDDPTCERIGKKTKTYSVVIDGITYSHTVETDIDKIDHNYSYASGVWTWNGYGAATYTVKCNMNRSHTYTYDAQIFTETVAPTCTENGAKIHTATVIIDGESYTTSVNQTLPKTNHSYDYENGTWVWSETDSATYVVCCLNDSSHTVSETVNTKSSSTSSPTCESGAVTTYTAKVFMNGTYYVDTKTVESEPLGHNYDVSTGEWTWMDNGTIAQLTFICNNGTPHSAVYDAEVEYTITVAPTCLDFGEAHARASVTVDGETYTDEVDYILDPIEHELDWENARLEWDETIGATLIVPCKLGEPHNFEAYATTDEEVVYPDCYSDGYRKYTVYFELYGYEITDEKVEVLSALGHNYEIDSVEWNGETDRVFAKVNLICKNDNRHTDSEIAYSEDSYVVEPTCVLSGVKLHTVTVKKGGQTFIVTNESVAPKRGHTFGASYCINCEVAVYSVGLEFKLNEDETGYVIVGTGDFAGEILSIPDTYNGLPVVEIAREVFEYNTKIKELYVSENIKTIGYAAFYNCSSLEKIYVSENETHSLNISEYAFSGCTTLKTLYIPSEVKNIRENAFSSCTSLESVRIGAKNVYNGSFYGCTSLRNIELLDGIDYIGDFINSYVPVNSLTIPSTVSFVESALFTNPKLIEVENLSKFEITTTSTLKNVYTATQGESYLWTDIVTGYVFFEMGDIRYLVGHCGEGSVSVLPETCNGYSYWINQYALLNIDFGRKPLYIPDGVVTIHAYAAYYNETIIAIWGGENVTDIGHHAFYGCTELLSVTLGAKLKNIYENAFGICDRVVELINHSSLNVQDRTIPMFPNLIKEIKDTSVTAPAIYYVEDDFVFYYRGETCYLVSYFGDGDDTVEGQITLPGLPDDWNVYTYGIYKRAIREVEGVTKVKLSSAVDQICTEAFTFGLEEIEIPVISSLKRIETEAFKWTAITDIFLPYELEYIGKLAFPETLERITFAAIDNWKCEGFIGMADVDPEDIKDPADAAKYILYRNKSTHFERVEEEA